VLCAFLPLISRFDGGLAWIALILSVTWAGDTGAYFSGRALGKTKLFERVSPKKTWEGFAGGFVGSIVGALIVQRLGLPNLPVMHAVILGGLLNVFGVVGDLVESMLKRAYGVKDSGWIMPGHGGILDRVDSILFTAPVAWIYATLLQLG
jgi:phosphatidate cytidylyltransferase